MQPSARAFSAPITTTVGAGFPGVELVGLCVHSNVARGDEFAARYGAASVYTDPAQMLDEAKPDLVDVITTPESHAELVGLATARGIPVICQKPLAPSFAEAQAIARMGESDGHADRRA